MLLKSTHRDGFTLIELLLVVSIIATLAAILFPAFARARARARQTNCLSQEKQLGMALLQYAADSDERFPNGVTPTADWFWAGQGWAGQTMPYLNDAELVLCPDDHTPSVMPNNFAVSYGYNINLVEPSNTRERPPERSGYYIGKTPPGVPFSSLAAPAHTVALFEVSGVTANILDPREGARPGSVMGDYFSASGNGLDNRLYAHTNDTTGTDNQYVTGYLGGRVPPDLSHTQFSPATGRHQNGSCFLLADGHAAWLPGSRVSSGVNARRDIDPQGETANGFSAAGVAAIAPHFSATFSVR